MEFVSAQRKRKCWIDMRKNIQSNQLPRKRNIKWDFFFTIKLADPVTKPNLGPLIHVVAKPISLLTLSCGEGKYAGCQARRMGSSCSKSPNSPMDFRERFLKAAFGVSSWWTFFWLAGDEITRWCFRNPKHLVPTLVPTSLGSTCLSACSHHPPPEWGVLVSAEQLKDLHQIIIMSLEEEIGLSFIAELFFKLSCLMLFLCFCIPSLP